MSKLSKRLFAAVSDKGRERKANRLDGLLLTDTDIDDLMKKQYDEDGAYVPMHASNFPSMSRKDVMMNLRIPPLGIHPPPFGDEQIQEIESKTSIKRENIEWVRQHWLDDKIAPDEKDMKVIVDDILEMQFAKVSYATINLWLDYISGADIMGNKHGIYNKSWMRIDS